MLLLLLAGGTTNEAWSATKKVTYHVITLPFGDNTGYYDGGGAFVNEKYRIEAIKMTVTQDEGAEIKLPSELKSPLMKYEAYSYYYKGNSGVTQSDLHKIFPDNPTTFYTYTFDNTKVLAPGTTVSALGENTDVYVTYVWDADHENLKEEYGKRLDLTGNKRYNIELSTNSGRWFYALNMNPERGNRGQAVPEGKLKSLDDLASDNYATIDGTVNGKNQFYFQWKLINNDPYNIIIQTAYKGDFVYKENNVPKSPVGAQFYGHLETASKIKNNWMTNEVDLNWNAGSSTPSSSPKHGWFRGPTGEGGVGTNGVSSYLYFSFTLLAHPTANYTLAASWANVMGKDWVPNASGQYLLMKHEPEAAPYAGPAFQTLESSDQVLLHEIREYNFKVETPLTKTILSAHVKMSDYEKNERLIDHVPDTLKRKYTSITGTYTTKEFNTARTTFETIFENDEPEVAKPRDIWLKYTTSMPFEAGTSTSTFNDLKWYNIYVNKEENYITWYDTRTSGEPPTSLNQFSTSEGASVHSKYGHDAHFAFIGDPYELYVTNRKASDPTPASLKYIKLDPTTPANSLISGDGGTFKYRAVQNGTTLTIGNTYYTSNEGVGEFTYNGQVSDGNNYFEEKYRYVAVPNGTPLNVGEIYYNTNVGGGAFTSNGSEVADDSNYYQYEGYYEAVPNGTRLTVGKTYYTYNESEAKYEGFLAAYETATGTNYWERIYDSNWEIIDDNNTGDYAGCFRLRQLNTYNAPVTIGWGSSSERPLNGNGSGGSTMARLSVLELPLMTYTYYIVDKSGRIAVMAKEEQLTGTVLNYEAIPEVIRSPFLASGDADRLTFKTYASKEIYDAGIAADYNFYTDPNSKFTTITNTNSVETDEYKNHIFVSYNPTKLTALTANPLKDEDNDAYSFNVILNNEYIYYEGDGVTGTIKSKTGFTDDDHAGDMQNLWVLGGEDPYAMIIRNRGAGAKGSETKKYVKVENWADGTIKWVENSSEATRFIIKSGTTEDSYEVMATTSVAKDGESNKIDVEHSTDANTTYYNIGRPDATTVKMFDNGTYAHGYAVIRFQLKKSTAKQVTYHLIDIARKELLTESARHAIEDSPIIPPEIFSPLVGYPNYKYWQSASTDGMGIVTCSDDYGDKKFSQIYNQAYWDGNNIDVYITYEDNKLVDLNHTTMYLLKYEQGEQFRQENGSDGLLDSLENFTGSEAEKKALYQAVYPYCNGDCNFFVYGQRQYDLQQEGAASTRTRWAWYLESSSQDPYHVKILSRQTETYDGLERSGYFATRIPDGYDKVVTSLVWPNISGVQATEYMVLGNVGQYQLVTTPVDGNGDGDYADEGEDKRNVVNSFEQYWKTYDTVKKKLLSDLLSSCEEKERTDRTDGSIEVPATPASLRERLTGTGPGQYGFHSYQKMSKAKRWNGYNASGEKSKGWESREHWFQTVSMGEGYFDLIPTTIDPALILLDQHGWEIMRKPLPSGPDDPTKAHKYEVLGSYDSPMVKEYIFWASASKRSGFHQYYKLDKRIGGSGFSSTSLTNLPPYGSENVMDTKGNLNDQYVTYIVKEEYATSYNPATKVGTEFLISQGNSLAKKGEIGDKITVGPNPGSTSQYIIDNIVTPGLRDELWFVIPNADIDTEMGYGTTSHNWSADNPNAYEDAAYKDNPVASIIEGASDDATVKKFGHFSFSNGFDPYNIQIRSKDDAKYFTLRMTSAKAEEGAMLGDYSGDGGSTTVVLADKASTTVVGNGYDNSKWAMTNQTFMAVQDAEGNMQLMPRFDHNLRMRDFASLVTPTAEAGNDSKLLETHTYLYRPFVYNYRIIDNQGRESLRYQSGGDLLPQTPDHFKSPLAKDFRYYKNLTETDGIYNEVKNKANISSKEITASLAGAGLTTPSATDGNIVYVRYAYDEEADTLRILLGKWLTMKLNDMDAIYTNGTGIVKAGTPKPAPVDGNTDKAWQWKFLKNPYLDPDPYAVQMFNRLADQKDKPMTTTTLAGGTVTATTDETPNAYQRFALLSHTDDGGSVDGYALVVAGTKGHADYYFLDGNTMAESVAAKTAKENGFTSSSGKFGVVKDAAKAESKILFTDDVENTYTYYVYTNGGAEAISDEQTQYEAADNGFVPILPNAIRTPLLNIDQFRYYEALTDTAYNSGKALKNLYGLYDGAVYVRYNAYDPHTSEYKVPNERNTPGTTVAKGEGSNDAPLRLDGKLPHNIIWYDDNMMKAGKTGDVYSTIIDGGSLSLQNAADYSWTFAGDDPYAIKIRHKSSAKYVHQKSEPTTECDLDASATTFMLLNREGYEYGVLATTGNKDVMLSGYYGNALVTDDHDPETTSDNPTKFIIFSLGTLKVIYHLVLANIGEYQPIPHRARDVAASYITGESDCWNTTDGKYSVPWSSTAPIDTIWVHGTTKRELSNSVYNLGDTGGVFYPDWEGNISSEDKTLYCKDAGPISLGDALAVPMEFYRPNVNYFFVVRDIRDDASTPNVALNTKYKGLQLTSNQMSMNEDLIGKIIYIDIVYSFNTDLESNSGDDFVRSISQNKWYTLETVIDGKTYLAQYTNAWGFELKEGRGSHFTNDFLWTPIGDPYGFQLVNRYMDVNSGDHNLGEKNRAITTIPYRTVIPKTSPVTDEAAHAFENGKQIVMGNYQDAGQRVVVPGGVAHTDIPAATIKTNSIYELLESNTLGFFRFHPVANTSNQPQVYFNPEWADDNGDGTDEYLIRLKTTAAEFTFGLSAELMKPYFDRAGYVGGLTKEAYNKAANAALVAAMKADNPVLTSAQLMQAQTLVYDSKNVVQFQTGYYRLHSPLGISGIDPARYVSGYTHLIESTDYDNDNEKDADGDGSKGNDVLPMHFYEENSNRQRQFTDFKDGGFTYSSATRGDLPILPVERDPASIFYFQKATGDADYPGAVTSADDRARYNLGYVSTQGLYIKGTVEKGVAEGNGVRAKAVMTANALPENAQTPTATSPTPLFVMDLGGGVLLIHDNHTALGRSVLKYLSYDYSNDTPGNPTIYDMKLTNHTHTDHAKFCMQPVQTTTTKGVNEMPLRLNLNQGGDGYYYATFCAPFDILLTDADNDAAYICKVWDTELIHLKKVGKYNVVADGCPAAYAGSNQFVPAGTPVVIRSKNASVMMALPTTSPSTTLADNYKLSGEGKASNIFSGVYLEQLLSDQETGSNDVYVFGLPFTGTATRDAYYYSANHANNGRITISLPQHEEKGVGFYINANYNRESFADMGSWLRNNRYVYGNRIYYRAPGGGGVHAPRQKTTSMDFIPVVFDDDEEEEGGSDYAVQRDRRMYDLQGRLVWSPSSATDKPMGLRPGIYIVGGRKVTVR